MASVVPNSTVWLLKNVPLDATYTHTLYFENETTQRNTFLGNGQGSPSWVIRTFDHQMYKRLDRNALRVAIEVERIYNCNYMCFLNNKIPTTQYPYGKMFYAFVTSINYISDNVTEIEYQIDYIQSYMFDYSLSQCFVEREHTLTDGKYEHTMPEPVGLGEYVIDRQLEPLVRIDAISDELGKMFNTIGYFVASTSKPVFTGDENDPNALGSPSYTIEKASPEIYSGILVGTYTQLFFLHDENDSFDLLMNRIARYLLAIDTVGYSDGVLNVFCAPIPFYYKTASGQQNVQYRDRAISYEFNISDKAAIAKRTHSGGVALVANNKCYSYPYNFMLVTSSDGTSAIYKYELSNTAVDSTKRYITFNASGTINSDGEFMLRPLGYRTVALDSVSLNYEDALMCTRTPLCGWNNDSYKCWLAQHKSGITAGVVSDSVSALGNFVKSMFFHRTPENKARGKYGKAARATNEANQKVSAFIDLGVSAVEIISNVLGTLGDAKAQPNTPRGDTTGVMDISNRTFGFRFYHCVVKPEYMTTIDDFFTKFGYCVMETKVPSINNRPEYTYVKTQGCEITGTADGRSVNSAVAREICDVFDNGITFWRHWNHVGDYTVNNTPTQNT